MSGFAYTPYIWPMLVSAICMAALALYAWRHRCVPGAAAFAVSALFMALWALFTAMEMAATSDAIKATLFRAEALVGLAGLTALLYFALEHASLGKWASRRTALLLSLVSGAIFILMATNDLHHLMWSRIWFDQWVRIERGPLNGLMLAWGLLLPTLALLVFLGLLLRSAGIYRRQALLLFAASALPLLTYLLEPAGINPVAPLDPVILVLTLSSLLYAVAIFRFRMLEIVPIGRDTAIERMASGVLVLDAQNRIVDVNPAAADVLALSRAAAVGRPAKQALAAHPDLAQVLDQQSATSAEISLNGTRQPLHLRVQSSPLTNPGGFYLGRLILLQDVTEQRQAQAQLLEQQRMLVAMEEREWLAQELHDSLSQSLGFLNVQAQAAQLYLRSDQGEAARAALDRLAEVSRGLQSEMRELIGNLLTDSLPTKGFCVTLRQVVARFQQQYGLAVCLDIDGPTEARCSPGLLAPDVGVQLIRIAQEALANVRKHAGSPNQIGVRLQ